MNKFTSFVYEFINSRKPTILMVSSDAPAITDSIDSRTYNIPLVLGSLKQLSVRRLLSADQYMSQKLLSAFLLHVDFNNKQNRIYFKDFAFQLLLFRNRGNKYEVFGYKDTFIIHNIDADYNYRQTFN